MIAQSCGATDEESKHASVGTEDIATWRRSKAAEMDRAAEQAVAQAHAAAEAARRAEAEAKAGAVRAGSGRRR